MESCLQFMQPNVDTFGYNKLKREQSNHTLLICVQNVKGPSTRIELSNSINNDVNLITEVSLY